MSETAAPPNFIRQIVEEDLRSGRHQSVVTRFPPEPNGYLHIGHAKAICVSFELAADFGGRCHLRMDDTNPLKESDEYVQGIIHDIRWLGFDWGPHFYHASDYFEQLYDWAKLLVRGGLAYVDEQSEEQIRTNRGTVESAGTASPWRERPAEESLALLERMAAGELPDGAMVLRAKIDMSHPNMKMRDPLLYRIRNVPHHHTGDRWHIYPLYDWAHGQSDAIEGVTHSLCSLEFDVNRELYDWFLDHLPVPARPHQYEFARLNITYTIMSKRSLRALVEEGHVRGWDDPRMTTLAGLRRRGVTPAAIRNFVRGVGVGKSDALVEWSLLENAVRDDLNDKAPRVLVVVDPILLVVEGQGEELRDAPLWPHDVGREGTRPLPLSGEVFIERRDFQPVPEPGFKRLAPGRAVRLRHGPVVVCVSHEVDAEGRVTRVICRPAVEDDKVGATIHWVSAPHGRPVELRLYDPLFLAAEPGKDRDFREDLNPASLTVVKAIAEPWLLGAEKGQHFQFERIGFFCADADSEPGAPVFNRVVALKDSWKKAPAAVRAQPAAEPAAGSVRTVRVLGERGRALVAAGLSEDEAAVLEADPALAAWYEEALARYAKPRAVSGWVVTELPRLAREAGGLDALPFRGAQVGALAELVDQGAITNGVGKQVLAALAEAGGEPVDIVAQRGWGKVDDPEVVGRAVDEVLAAFPDRVAAYRGGRTGLIGFFVGQVVQKTGGRADPQQIRAALEAKLA